MAEEEEDATPEDAPDEELDAEEEDEDSDLTETGDAHTFGKAFGCLE